jgi:hypothetical protein
MKHKKEPGTRSKQKPAPRRIRLPGFITDEEIGLGDVIKRTTHYLGIKPCRGCERRAAALNHWLLFTNRPSR